MAKQTLPDSGANRNPVEIISALNMEFPPPGSILCLDLGGKTGWALKQTDGQITSGTIEFKPGRFEGGGMTFLRFKSWLDEINDFAGPIHSIHFEEVRRHLGTTAAHIYGGFLACLTSWCEARSIPYQGIPVGTIKKYATGKGNSGKEAVIKAMKNLGHNPVDDNEADALAILHLVLSREISS
jgi:crossover junction endodeoxyribonuclease RuvC